MNPGPPVVSSDATAPPVTGRDQTRHRPRRCWLLLAGVALVLMMVVRGFVVQSFYIPSGSMEPTLAPGDRILVDKLSATSSMQRGDLVVFDGTRTFDRDNAQTSTTDSGPIGKVMSSIASLLSVQTDQTDYVKRVVGLPGDHVACCDARGLLRVNGTAVHEPYLHTGDAPSDVTFDVTVPPRRIWVMGDHRSASADSRAHLGDPGGGMVRLDDIIGRAAAIYWPVSRAVVLRAPGALSGIRSQAARGRAGTSTTRTMSASANPGAR